MAKPTLKVMSVVGARPNFMKIASICRAIEDHNACHKDPSIRHLIVHTGQHYDNHMSLLFFEELRLPKPHVNLNVGSASHAVQTAQIMERFEPVLMEHEPDVMILVGDVNSTIACALVASKIRYDCSTQTSKLKTHNSGLIRPLVAHVEAGLRSFDRSMPEEINRILTDALSDLLFITEEDAVVNLEREGVSREKIYFVGNVMIDTLLINLEKAQSIKTSQSQENFIRNGYGLVTLHRPSNVDTPQTLIPLMDCLQTISSRLPILFPLHPRTRSNLERFGIYQTLMNTNGILLTEPLGYLEFLALLKSARLVLTDSGGIQEETTFLRIPCITLRENTERPATIRLGTNYLVGTNPENILQTTFKILDGQGKKGEIPPLWDGQAGRRIVEILTNKLVTGDR